MLGGAHVRHRSFGDVRVHREAYPKQDTCTDARSVGDGVRLGSATAETPSCVMAGRRSLTTGLRIDGRAGEGDKLIERTFRGLPRFG